MLTEKIEELLLARMHPVLEHRSFSLVVRFRFLKQNLGFVIAYQPRAAVRGFYDKNLRETTQRTSNWASVAGRPAATRAFFAPLCGIRSKSFRNKKVLKLEV